TAARTRFESPGASRNRSTRTWFARQHPAGRARAGRIRFEAPDRSAPNLGVVRAAALCTSCASRANQVRSTGPERPEPGCRSRGSTRHVVREPGESGSQSRLRLQLDELRDDAVDAKHPDAVTRMEVAEAG